jgi:hypothetical protein
MKPRAIGARGHAGVTGAITGRRGYAPNPGVLQRRRTQGTLAVWGSSTRRTLGVTGAITGGGEARVTMGHQRHRSQGSLAVWQLDALGHSKREDAPDQRDVDGNELSNAGGSVTSLNANGTGTLAVSRAARAWPKRGGR